MTSELLSFAGKTFLLDINAMSKYCELPEERTIVVTTESSNKNLDQKYITTKDKSVFDPIKYEMVKNMIDIILDPAESADEDEDLGADHLLAGKSLDFKIAFNTLVNNKILIEVND